MIPGRSANTFFSTAKRLLPSLLAMAALVGAPDFAHCGAIFNTGHLDQPLASVNFPNQITDSQPWSNQILATDGAPGEFGVNSGLWGHFNGYDGVTASSNPVYLHSQHGTAFIQPVTDGSGANVLAVMHTLAISAPQGYGFTGIDFQLDYNNDHQAGTVSFYAYDVYGKPISLNSGTNTFSIKTSGQDDYYAQTTGGLLMGTLVIQTSDSAPISDLKQVDVQGVHATPAPSSLTMASILAGVFGLVWTVRRRKQAAVTA